MDSAQRKNFSAYVSAKDWDNNAINYTFYNTLSWGKSFGGNQSGSARNTNGTRWVEPDDAKPSAKNGSSGMPTAAS